MRLLDRLAVRINPVLLENLTVTQLVQKFTAFYGTVTFIIVFTSATGLYPDLNSASSHLLTLLL